MKQTLLTLLLIFGYLCSFAQTPCAPLGADRCINAPLINPCQLDGWEGNTNPPNVNYFWNNDIPRTGWCNNDWTIHNNQWLRFTADAESLDIQVDVSNCQNNEGIQMACYEIGDANNCPGDQITCFGEGATSVFIFEIDDLVPGNQYLLMIDGFSGDGCPFTLHLPSVPMEVEVDAVTLPICPGVPVEGALMGTVTFGDGDDIITGWFTENGNIVSGHFTSEPIIDQPGDYTFFAYNTETCCSAVQTVTVEASTVFPEAQASVIKHIDCNDMTATLSAEGSQLDDDDYEYEYLWSFQGGNPAGEGFILEDLIYPGIYILTVRNINTGCETEVEVVVLEDFTEPEIALLNPPVLDCNNTTIFLSVDAPIGSTFAWANDDGFSSSEQAPEISEPGIYNVVVTGSNGCTNDAMIEVTVDTEAPLLQVVAPTIDCANETASIIVLNDNDETTYSWNGPNFSSTDKEPVINTAGTYFLIATNPNGCDNEFIVQVEQDITPPEIAIDPADLLDCNLIEFSLIANSPNEITSYVWSGPNDFSSDEESPLINQAGVYNLIVTDEKGCTNTASIEIEDNVAEPVLVLSPDNVLSCSFEEVNITGQTSDDIISYEWSNNLGTESTAAVEQAGTYFVTITGSNGCTNVSEVIVTDNFVEPDPNAGADAIITCTQTETTLQGSGNSASGSGVSYEWSLNGNIIGDTENIDVAATGTYILTITDLENGCTAQDEVVVSADENLPEVVIEDAGNLDCNITSILLSGENSSSGSDITYTWLDTDMNIVGSEVELNVSQAGEYTLIVTNIANGCDSESSIQIDQDITPPEIAIGPAQALDCNMTSINLTSNSPNEIVSYQWSSANGFSSSDEEPTISEAGTYELIVIDDKGCTNNTSIIVEDDIVEPVLNLTSDGVLACNNSEVIIESQTNDIIVAYNWSNNLGTENTAAVEQAGIYFVTVTAENGCTNIAEVEVAENFMAPTLNAIPDAIITCMQNETLLQGSATSATGADLSYEWLLEGNIVGNSSSVSVSTTGNYQLLITDQENGCTAIDDILVSADENLPEVAIDGIATIDCSTSSIMLSGMNSSTGADINYTWLDANQTEIGNEVEVEIGQAGEYTLVVSNASNGCMSALTIQVEDDFSAPNVDAGPSQIITCDINSVLLDGSNSPQGSNYSFAWFNSNDVLVGENIMVEVENPDTYTLVITDSRNGCTSSEDVVVTPDENIPAVEIANNGFLSCMQDEVNLFSTLDIDPNFSYAWQNENGQTLSEEVSFTTQEAGVYNLVVTDIRNGCSNSMSISVDENFDLPEVITPLPDFISCNNSEVSIATSLEDTSMDVSYAWINASGTLLGDQSNLNVNEAGIYTLTTTNNSSGCTQEINVEVLENFDIEDAGIVVSNTIDCNNPTALVAAVAISTDDHTFTWLDSDGNLLSEEERFTIDASGEYALIVTNTISGCTSIANTMVDEDLETPELNIPPTDVLNCVTIEVQLNVDADQNPSYIYQWIDMNGNNVGNTSDLTVDTPGEYTLAITDSTNGCSNTSSIIVEENINTPEAIIDDLAPLGLSCTQQSVLLDGAASTPIGNVQYQWFDQNGSLVGTASSYEANSPGDYQLLITDLTTFCISESFTNVTQNDDLPAANIELPEILNCNVSTIILDAGQSELGSNFVYSWDIPNGAMDFDDSNILAPSTSTPGVYTITVLNTETGCENDFEVEVLSDFIEPIAQANAEDEFDCVTSAVQINANGSSDGSEFSYAWNIDGSLVTDVDVITVQNPGEYSLVITNNINGCTRETTVMVNENLERPTAFDVSGEDITCFGFDDGFFQVNGVIGGTPPYIFNIQGQDLEGLPSSENLAPGNYPILVTDAIGCTLETTINVEEPPKVFVDLGEDITINLGESAFLNANTNVNGIDWFSQDPLDCAQDCFTQEVSPFVTTVYEVEVYDENGCTETANVVVNVQFDRGVYIPNAFSPNGDGFNDYFQVFGNNAVLQVKSMLIADRWGEIVYEAENLLLEEEQKFWDGLHRGERMNDDVLVYYVVVEYIDGRTESFKGDVTLIR